jgi:hypothetical protein
VRDTYYEIRNSHLYPVALNTLYDYFFENYVGETDNVKFPVSLWNYGGDLNINVPRTNNAIEGRHSVFKKSFGTSRFSFNLLVDKLRQEEDAIRIKLIRHENGEILTRKKRFVILERNLRMFLSENTNNFSFDFLCELSSFIFYD